MAHRRRAVLTTCLECGAPCRGPRCDVHTAPTVLPVATLERHPSLRKSGSVYATPRWRRLAEHTVRAWRRAQGNWCPGYERPPHPRADLAADHLIPLAKGGEPFDPRNVGVLCTSCNSAKGAR